MSVNFDVLKDPSSDDFFAELDYTVRRLKEKDASRAFRILVRILTEGNESDVESAVADTIYQLILYPEIRAIFIDKSYISQIPFDLRSIRDDLFNILYVLALWNPEVFNEDIVKEFQILIKKNPSKSLRIISVIAQHYPIAYTSYTMLDQLIAGKLIFSREETAVQYAATIGYLCGISKTFTDARKKYLHPILMSLLSSEDKKIVNAALSALTEIANRDPSLGVPFDFVVDNISDVDLHLSLLNLMMVSDIGDAAHQMDEQCVQLFLEAAASTPGVLYILVKLSENSSVAYWLMNDLNWLNDSSMPIDCRLRLLEAIFAHSRVRHHIAEYECFYSFISEAISAAMPEYLSVVSTIICRLHLDGEIVQQFESYSMCKMFIEFASQIESADVYYDAISLISAIAQIRYSADFIPACKFIKKVLQEEKCEQSELFDLIIDLCRYDKCRKAFNEIHIPKLLNRIREQGCNTELIDRIQRKLRSSNS